MSKAKSGVLEDALGLEDGHILKSLALALKVKSFVSKPKSSKNALSLARRQQSFLSC